MKTDVSLSVSGLDALGSNGEGITGINITYGYNMIPVASLSLNTPWVQKNAPNLFQGISGYKKKTKPDKVKITIKTVTGCLNFSGFMDGLSSQMMSGGMQFSAIVKNRFQILSDMYPKYIGVYPGSTLAYRRIANLSIDSDNPAEMYKELCSEINLVQPPAKFYVEALKKIATSQTNTALWGDTKELSALRRILEQKTYKDNLTNLIKELDNIDLSNADTPGWTCSQSPEFFSDMLFNGGDTAWDLLVNGMGAIGCVLVPSNEKLYVVPQSNFIKLDGQRPGDSKTHASTPNTAYPADYNNFVLNDTSSKDIRYCFVECSDNALSFEITPSSIYADYLGQYPANDNDIRPDDGSAGILVVRAPAYLARSAMAGVAAHTSKVRKGIEGGKAYPDAGKGGIPTDSDAAAAAMEAENAKVTSSIGRDANEIKIKMDKYAKARFLQEKYVERAGSFVVQFNPNWVPGTTGFLACGSPCIVYNFYVTSVTHSISISEGRTGTAVTQVTFNAARWGTDSGKLLSVESNELYNYDSGKMQAFQQAWLSDNNAKYSLRK